MYVHELNCSYEHYSVHFPAMKLQFYSYSIIETSQQSLFAEKKADKPALLEAILREKVSKQVFANHNAMLGFLLYDKVNNYLFGSLGKRSTSTITHSPKEDFLEEPTEDWKRCYLFVSLDPKKQYIAIEHKPSVFAHPLHTLRRLGDEINPYLLEQSYEIGINPVLDPRKFWDVVSEYEGKIQKLKFEYLAPNFLNLDSSLHQGLKKAKEATGMTNLSLIFENHEGNLMIPKGKQMIEETVEEATKGGGSIEIRIRGGKKVYDSNKNENIKSVDLDVDVSLEDAKSEDIRYLIDKAFSCLD